MDGGKSARAEYRKQREVLIDMLRELAHYVEANCKGSMELFRSSEFEPAPTETTQTAPLSKTIRSLRPDPNSGQVWLKHMASDDAYSYKARWAPWTEGEPEWSEMAIGYTRPATLITGLKFRHILSFPGELPGERRLHRLERLRGLALYVTRTGMDRTFFLLIFVGIY
jgi:hypothetical protein